MKKLTILVSILVLVVCFAAAQQPQQLQQQKILPGGQLTIAIDTTLVKNAIAAFPHDKETAQQAANLANQQDTSDRLMDAIEEIIIIDPVKVDAIFKKYRITYTDKNGKKTGY